jgi:hypothetical protein
MSPNAPGLEPARWSDEEREAYYARRESRNRALGLVLFALVVLFFGITVVRMTGKPPAIPPDPPPGSAAERTGPGL